LQKKQDINAPGGNYDVFHFSISQPIVTCYYLSIRYGKVYETKNFIWQDIYADSDSDLLSSILTQFYSNRPKSNISHLITNIKPEPKESIEKIICEAVGRKVKIIHKPQSEKAQWLKIASQNSEYCNDTGLYNMILTKLASEFNLNSTPKHIECFDISHTSGTNATASCVVFKNGIVDKRAARHLKVNPKVPGDDYEAIKIAVNRRYNKKLTELEELPDLIIIDGGRGQLNSAYSAIKEMKIESVVDLISISKGEGRVEGLETVHFGSNSSMPIKKDEPQHKLLLRIRNEAHSHALKKHVKARTKTSLKSILLDIPNIGPKKRKALLSHFASINDIKTCSVKDLQQVEGINEKLAKTIKSFFEE
jgi:excinuclease ABC subunit C